jgi:hypothetical protein
MDRPVPGEVATFLAPYPGAVYDLAVGLRAQVLAVMPNAHEFVWDATNAVSLAYTPTTDWHDGIVHIACYAKHVNLGFNDGATLPDPLGLLAGSGSRIRHVSFRTTDEVAAGWIGDYVRAALAQAQVPDDAGDGGTTVRVSNGPKRRPA